MVLKKQPAGTQLQQLQKNANGGGKKMCKAYFVCLIVENHQNKKAPSWKIVDTKTRTRAQTHIKVIVENKIKTYQKHGYKESRTG
jgi:ribosomal protein L39E